MRLLERYVLSELIRVFGVLVTGTGCHSGLLTLEGPGAVGASTTRAVVSGIVLVVVAGAHRGDAFAACEFIMDYLKTEAPFWKKEATPQGHRWVDARVSDDQALKRWGIVSSNASPV